MYRSTRTNGDPLSLVHPRNKPGYFSLASPVRTPARALPYRAETVPVAAAPLIQPLPGVTFVLDSDDAGS